MPKSKEKCKEIREETKEKILRESIRYFAKNGLAGTKIGDLSRQIGIAQGTIYTYFKSKEDIFYEIMNTINFKEELKEITVLSMLPISAKVKIHKLSESILEKLQNNVDYPAKIVLNTQIILEEKLYDSLVTTYSSDLYKITEKIIKQGQKEETVVSGNTLKLVDYYWGVVYLYALKKIFTAQYEDITVQDLERILLKDGNS